MSYYNEEEDIECNMECDECEDFDECESEDKLYPGGLTYEEATEQYLNDPNIDDSVDWSGRPLSDYGERIYRLLHYEDDNDEMD